MTPRRILAAEDSPTQAAVLRDHLEAAGFEVWLASNGAEALALMEDDLSFDLVVSDVVMPDVDGYDLCRGVKERYPSIPVVLLTSLNDPLDVVNALSAGADNFLRKPYAPDELVHRISNMLHNKQLRESGRAQMGLELFFLGRRFMINADREQILDLLVSTFEDLVAVNHRLRAREEDLAEARDELAARLTEASLERDRVSAVLGAIPAGMAVFDLDGRVINANERLAELLAMPMPLLQGAVVWDLVTFTDHAGEPLRREDRALNTSLCEGSGALKGTAFDLFVVRSDGSRVPVIARTAPVRDHNGTIVGAVGTLEDLRTLIDHDPVTGLAGQAMLVDRLAAAAESSSERGVQTGVLVLVVDRFERIRKVLPGTGEQARSAIGAKLRRALGSEEIRQRAPTASAASLGDGELAVVLPDIEGDLDAIAVAHRLCERLSGTIELDGIDLPVTISAAVGMCDEAADSATLVASVAASARKVSRDGGDRVAVSDDGVHGGVIDLLRREGELRAAIDTGQLVVHYQPQVNVRDGAPVGVEALVRWQHPQHGLLGAGEVIPLAIESGLISAVGWFVLEEACRYMAQWHNDRTDGRPPLLSVNVAAEQLASAEVDVRVAGILERTGFDPRLLVLEITEGSVMGNTDTANEHLRALKALGVQIAIDDFGTGYSSLLQLRRLPIDVLKIDRAFIAGMLEEPADAAIVTATIRLARALGLEVVAEGVESADQLVQLRVHGCDLAQGYHWAKPLAGEELDSWWSEHSTDPGFDGSAAGPPEVTDDRQDEIISYLVHELRSPLAAITGFAAMLQESSGVEPSTDFLDAIVRNAHELDSRLESLREANDVLRGGLTLQAEDRDVTELVQTLVHDLSPGLAPHAVELSAAEPVVASVDPVRLGQAVSNLIVNAAKFSPATEPIEVTVTTTDAVANITVRDHGPGVPGHRQAELFRRFSRLGATSKGMGLGLYLARVVVEAHGGVLRYDDAPGGGAAFSIRLPRRSHTR